MFWDEHGSRRNWGASKSFGRTHRGCKGSIKSKVGNKGQGEARDRSEGRGKFKLKHGKAMGCRLSQGAERYPQLRKESEGRPQTSQGQSDNLPQGHELGSTEASKNFRAFNSLKTFLKTRICSSRDVCSGIGSVPKLAQLTVPWYAEKMTAWALNWEWG